MALVDKFKNMVDELNRCNRDIKAIYPKFEQANAQQAKNEQMLRELPPQEQSVRDQIERLKRQLAELQKKKAACLGNREKLMRQKEKMKAIMAEKRAKKEELERAIAVIQKFRMDQYMAENYGSPPDAVF